MSTYLAYDPHVQNVLSRSDAAQWPKHFQLRNWDHIYNIPWPIPLVTRRCNLKLPSTHLQILSRRLPCTGRDECWEKQEHGYFVLVFFASNYFEVVLNVELEVGHIQPGLLEPAPGPVIILGIHLCGTLVVKLQKGAGVGNFCMFFFSAVHSNERRLWGLLSIRAIETFNRGPKCVAFALKPCCLPSMHYVPWFDG